MLIGTDFNSIFKNTVNTTATLVLYEVSVIFLDYDLKTLAKDANLCISFRSF